MPCRAFRRKAQAAGNLKSDGKQVVTVETGDRLHRAGGSTGDLRAAIQPDDGRHLRRAVLGLLPDPLPVVLLPLSAGGGAGDGRHLGGGDRRGLGRQPLRDYCGDANININRNTNINTGNINRGAGAAAAAGGRQCLEVEQAARPGQQLGRQDGLVRSRGRGSAAGAGAGAGRPSSPQGAGGGAAGRAQTAGSVSAGGAARRAQSAGSVSVGGSATRSGGSGSAMSGYGSGSGRQTQMDSSRGASSRSSMSGGGGGADRRCGGGGGGARGGGGGGGRGGGGGGRR